MTFANLKLNENGSQQTVFTFRKIELSCSRLVIVSIKRKNYSMLKYRKLEFRESDMSPVKTQVKLVKFISTGEGLF